MKWQKEYNGFESINDLSQDIDEAISEGEVIPKDEPEFQGKLIVTMEYFPYARQTTI